MSFPADEEYGVPLVSAPLGELPKRLMIIDIVRVSHPRPALPDSLFIQISVSDIPIMQPLSTADMVSHRVFSFSLFITGHVCVWSMTHTSKK
jgi:hypothetical protein